MKNSSFNKVLTTYFIIFTFIIFLLIFLLQKIFFNTMNNFMIENNAKKIKDYIVNQIDSDNIYTIIDEYAHNNSLLIYIIDSSNNILYSSDSYKVSQQLNKETKKATSNPYLKDKVLSYQKENYRYLPENYDEFIIKIENRNSLSYKNENQFILGEKLIESKNFLNSVLYISVPLSISGGIVNTMNFQLIIAIVVSFIIAIIISIIISNKFNEPITVLVKKAENIGGDDYIYETTPVFCNEISLISSILDKTNTKLENNKNYQNELLSNISHDLRTPLTVIKGYAEMIKDVDLENKNEVVSDAELIINESNRLNEMVNEILEYSKLQLTDYRNEFINIDLTKIINDVVNKTSILAKNKKVLMEVICYDSLCIIGVESLIERAIYNLVDNAILHAKNKITISAQYIERDNSIIIQVIDDGEGIKKDDLPYVFDRYFTKRMNKNHVSGIGLSIVKQIALIHNAKYGVESELGKGTKFYLIFDK